MMQPHWDQERAQKWRLFMPPARPSKEEVSEYSRIIDDLSINEQGKLVLFGSTPEIRSLAAYKNKKILCVDINQDVYEELESMKTAQGPELFLCSDWLTVDVPEKSDLILADGSLNMLFPDRHSDFIRKTYNLLKPKGHFIIRVHVLGKKQFDKPEDIFKWYRDHNQDEPVFTATRTHLDMLWADKETGRIEFQKYHRDIQELYYDKVITKEEFDAYDILLKYNKIVLHYVRQNDFESEINKYYEIKSISFGKDYTGYEYHPIYCLSRRD